jgi:histidyl-tRNA synthetase
MASTVNPPRGMRDFLPQDKAKREQALAVIRSVFRAHGFDEIETPVMEESSRLHAGLGGDNEKLAFGVLKRGLTAEDLHAANDALDLADLGLRFDLTVPLTRFYATNHGALPTVLKSIQIGPVWRAERPQKGRYRQFMQCDIDVIGEAGPLAEVELLTATGATLDALGIEDWTIRVNDRRLLTGMLDVLGFARENLESILITIDKLDKIGHDGVVAELRERGVTPDAVDALEAFFRRPVTLEYLPFGEAAIAKLLPTGVDGTVIAELASIGRAIEEARGNPDAPVVQFDPFLVRGMGYYTGMIFEVAHPSSTSSLGGGGRYDGMVGRFLGTEVPATGASIGFERILDLVRLDADEGADAVALLYDAEVPPARLAGLKTALIAQGRRVRLERRPRNVKPVLEQLAASGYRSVASVTAATESIDDLEFRPLGG